MFRGGDKSMRRNLVTWEEKLDPSKFMEISSQEKAEDLGGRSALLALS